MMLSSEIEAELLRDNPNARRVAVSILADQLRVYAEAADNVARMGSIVAHPRTNAPIENPYLKVMQSTATKILAARGIRADRVFELVRAAVARAAEEAARAELEAARVREGSGGGERVG